MPDSGNPYSGTTFADRRAARLGLAKAEDQKAVHADEVEDKAVTSAATKARKAPASRGKG